MLPMTPTEFNALPVGVAQAIEAEVGFLTSEHVHTLATVWPDVRLLVRCHAAPRYLTTAGGCENEIGMRGDDIRDVSVCAQDFPLVQLRASAFWARLDEKLLPAIVENLVRDRRPESRKLVVR